MCGHKKPQGSQTSVTTYVEGDNNQSMTVLCSIPTRAPTLTLQSLDEHGVTVAWDTAEQMTGTTITVSRVNNISQQDLANE